MNLRSDVQDRSNVWVILPAFNEAQVIAGVVGPLRREFRNVLVVDDGSADATADLAVGAGALVLRHPINLGQGAALQTGITFALRQDAEFVVTFDADGQHQVADISRLIAGLETSGADFALGSRFLGSTLNLPGRRKLLLRLAVLFTRMTTGLKLTDAHNGLRAMTRTGASRLRLRQNGMAHASELLEQIAESGLRYVEVPVRIEYTPYSLAKGQKLSNSFRILADLLAGKLQK